VRIQRYLLSLAAGLLIGTSIVAASGAEALLVKPKQLPGPAAPQTVEELTRAGAWTPEKLFHAFGC